MFVNFYIMRICSLESIPFPVHSIGTRNLILPGVFQHFIQTSTPLKDLLRFSSYSLSPLFSHWEVFDRIWHFIISLRIISRATYKNRRWELILLVLLDDFWLISKFFFIVFFFNRNSSFSFLLHIIRSYFGYSMQGLPRSQLRQTLWHLRLRRLCWFLQTFDQKEQTVRVQIKIGRPLRGE